MSPTNLAKITRVSRAIIGRYEWGEASSSIEMAMKIAEGLDVSLSYQLFPHGQADPQTD